MDESELTKRDRRILEKAARYRRQQITEILQEVEDFRGKSEKKKLNVTTITGEQLENKLTESYSPIIVYQGWSGAPAGGAVNYTVGIRNPDPVRHIWLFAHVFVGLANIVPRVGPAAAAVDPRFPRLTQPRFSGLGIDPGVTQSLNFSIPVPAGIEPSNYLGNTFLLHATWHDVGDYLDRSLFVFQVT